MGAAFTLDDALACLGVLLPLLLCVWILSAPEHKRAIRSPKTRAGTEGPGEKSSLMYWVSGCWLRGHCWRSVGSYVNRGRWFECKHCTNCGKTREVTR